MIDKVYEFREFYIPGRMAGAIHRWIDLGIIPESFLQAVLENDLKRAVTLADEENLANLPAYIGYFYNEAPSGCSGSLKAVAHWHKRQEEARCAFHDANNAT